MTYNWQNIMYSDPLYKKELGQRIKNLRKDHTWTQKELAQKVDIKFQILNKYESGLNTPPVKMLIALAHALNVSLDFLLTGVADSEGKHTNPKLIKRIEAIENFDAEDQHLIIKFLDAMIFKNTAQGTLANYDS